MSTGRTPNRSPMERVFGAVVPTVVGAVDPDELIERIDVNALMARIDIDDLLARIDVNGIVEQVDVNGIIDKVDINGIINKVDLDGVIQKVDLDQVLTRLDLNALLGRLDLDALVGQLDLDALVGRLDVNALVAKLDVNAVVNQVDIKAVAANAGIDEIVAGATTGVATRTLDLARRQLLGLDLIVLRVVDRIFRRRTDHVAARGGATGRPAGPITRLLAFGVDAALVTLLFSLSVSVGTTLLSLFTGDRFQPTDGGGPIWAVAYFGWWGFYLWMSVLVAGRTPGKALLGLRVVALDGSPLGPGRSLARTVAFPFSFIFGLGFIPGVVRTDRRAFHELVAGCQELVDWGDRSAELPNALQGWLDRKAVSEGLELPAPTDTGRPITPEVAS